MCVFFLSVNCTAGVRIRVHIVIIYCMHLGPAKCNSVCWFCFSIPSNESQSDVSTMPEMHIHILLNQSNRQRSENTKKSLCKWREKALIKLLSRIAIWFKNNVFHTTFNKSTLAHTENIIQTRGRIEAKKIQRIS